MCIQTLALGVSAEPQQLSEPQLPTNQMERLVPLLEKTDAGKDWSQEEKGLAEDEMVR